MHSTLIYTITDTTISLKVNAKECVIKCNITFDRGLIKASTQRRRTVRIRFRTGFLRRSGHKSKNFLSFMICGTYLDHICIGNRKMHNTAIRYPHYLQERYHSSVLAATVQDWASICQDRLQSMGMGRL